MDDPHILIAISNFNVNDVNLIVRVDDSYLIPALQFRDSFLGHQQSVFRHRSKGTNAAELSRAENIVWIRERSDNRNRSRLRVYLPICEQNPALRWIDLVVCECKLDWN